MFTSRVRLTAAIMLALLIGTPSVGQEASKPDAAETTPVKAAEPESAKKSAQPEPKAPSKSAQPPEKDARPAAATKTSGNQPEAKPQAKGAEETQASVKTKVDEDNAKTKDAKATDEDNGWGKGSEHIVYVPYQKLSDVFEKETGNVLLPFQEYKRLWDAVRKMGASLARPPVPALVTNLRYQGSVKDDSATLTATLTVDVLSDDWVKLPVTFENVAVSTVKGATLAAEGPGKYSLLLKGRKSHEVTLQMSATVTRTPEGRTLVLKGPVAASTSLELTIPGKDLDVELSPKLATVQKSSTETDTKIVTVLGAADAITVSWREKRETMVAQALVIAQNNMRVSFGDGVIHTQAAINYRLLRGETGELQFSLPRNERLLDIQGPGVRDWRSVEEGEQTIVSVRLYAPVKKSVQLTIDAERPLADGPQTVGVVRARNVQRETGVVAVHGNDQLSLTVAERNGLTRVAPAEVPKTLRRTGAFYFKYYTADFELSITAVAVEPRVNVVSRSVFQLLQGRLRGDTTLQYDVQRAGLFSVGIRLPKGVDLEQVRASSFDRYEIDQADDSQIVHVRLGQKVMGSLTVTLSTSVDRPDPNAGLQLPLPEPIDARAERGLVALLAHESFEVSGNTADSQGMRPAQPDELAAEGLRPPRVARMTLASSFRYLQRPVTAAFDVKKRNTRVVADTYTHVHISENTVTTRATIVFNVQYAGTDTFKLLVPDAVADRVEITGEAIKEKKRGDSADGLTPWTVVLHTSTLGRHPLVVTYKEPIELKEDESSSIDVPLKLARPDGVERENGQLVVTKERALALEATTEDVEPIDPRQIRVPAGVDASSQKSEVQLAYRYYRHPVSVDLNVTKHEIQRVIETIVTRALVESVVPEEGPITYRARYQLKSSQRQRLKLLLPKGARFLGVNVAGRSVLPERSRPEQEGEEPDFDEYLINVSRSTGADQPFPMTVLYEQPADQWDGLQKLTIEPQHPPRLPLVMPLFNGDVTFQRLFWQVWLPKRYTSVGRPDGFTDENESALALIRGVDGAPPSLPELNRWTSEWSQAAGMTVFEFPTVGKAFTFSSLVGQPVLHVSYGYVPAMISVSSIAVFLLMAFMLPLRFASKLTAVLVLALVVFTLSLSYPEAVFRWLAAAEYGLFFGLGLWLVRGAVHWRRRWEQHRAERSARADDEDEEGDGGNDQPPPPSTPPDQGEPVGAGVSSGDAEGLELSAGSVDDSQGGASDEK